MRPIKEKKKNENSEQKVNQNFWKSYDFWKTSVPQVTVKVTITKVMVK